MTKVTLQPVGGTAPVSVEVEWRESGAGFALTLEGRTVTGSGIVNPDGEGLLRIGSRVVPFYAVRAGEELQLWLGGQTYWFTLAERGPRRSGQLLPAGGEVVSPMPGQVLKVLVQPGQAVEAGDPLTVIESMKMELTIPAPAAGTVAEVLCGPGVMVDVGAALLRLHVREDP